MRIRYPSQYPRGYGDLRDRTREPEIRRIGQARGGFEDPRVPNHIRSLLWITSLTEITIGP